MVRFSRSNFLSNELALLNWTNDTGKMTSAMNQNYGNALVNGGAATAWLDGMTVYNYCFTGATHTYKGVGAFVDKMTYGMYQNYEPTATNGAPSKYLIIFTDGKDNSGNEQASKDYADNLKNNGYTIMTVFMQSAGMTDGDISHSEEFLKYLASDKPGGGKYFYSAMYNDTDTLVRAFQEMAAEVAHPLQDHSVKDYIDPRPDVIDRDGEILARLGVKTALILPKGGRCLPQTENRPQ